MRNSDAIAVRSGSDEIGLTDENGNSFISRIERHVESASPNTSCASSIGLGLLMWVIAIANCVRTPNKNHGVPFDREVSALSDDHSHLTLLAQLHEGIEHLRLDDGPSILAEIWSMTTLA